MLKIAYSSAITLAAMLKTSLVVSFSPSFARTFSSKERRLSTRQSRRQKHVLTYSHANKPLGLSERAYYLRCFIKECITCTVHQTHHQHLVIASAGFSNFFASFAVMRVERNSFIRLS